MQNRKLPLIIVIAGLLVAAIITIWVVQINQPKPRQAAQPLTQGESEIPFPEIERISVEQAFAAHNTGETVFLDVRDLDSYQSTHITGAVLIPLEELETRLSELDPTRPIIPY